MLSEEIVQDGFHSYLKSSLTQAKVERLLDADLLSSAEADLMIAGPALCFYFAALRCTTDPPSVPLPLTTASRLNGSASDTEPQQAALTYLNCPPVFSTFLRVWSSAVPIIQSLPSSQQHDLARLICSLPPLLPPPTPPEVFGVAADLRAVAIEISQRRSFQNRFGDDLQAALDAGSEEKSGRRVALFVPPPMYEPSPTPTRTPSPDYRCSSLSPTIISPNTEAIELIRETLYASLADVLERSPSICAMLVRDRPRAYFSCVALAILDVASSRTGFVTPTTSPSVSPAPASPPLPEPAPAPVSRPLRLSWSRSKSKSKLPKIPIITTESEADTNSITRSSLTSTSLGHSMVRRQNPNQNREPVMTLVLGCPLTLEKCPPPLRWFMRELASIGHDARVLAAADDRRAMERAALGQSVSLGRIDRVRRVLERGVGWEFASHEAETQGLGNGLGGEVERVEQEGAGNAVGNRFGNERRRSVEGRAVAFANRINALALGMTRMQAFRDRQEDVFKVLASVCVK